LEQDSLGFSFGLASQLLIEGREEVVVDRGGEKEYLISDAIPILLSEGLAPACLRHSSFPRPTVCMHLRGDVGEPFREPLSEGVWDSARIGRAQSQKLVIQDGGPTLTGYGWADRVVGSTQTML
jgi:hypothetical protein